MNSTVHGVLSAIFAVWGTQFVDIPPGKVWTHIEPIQLFALTITSGYCIVDNTLLVIYWKEFREV